MSNLTPTAPGSGIASRPLFGISAALTTPFSPDGAVDTERMCRHARAVLAAGASSVTLFGTTGEGASLDDGDRGLALDAARAGGIGAASIVVGICAPSAGGAIAQIRQAVEHGVGTVLLPPPFFFKAVSEAGLFAWYSKVLGAFEGAALRVILYHIPQVTGVPLSLPLIRDLKKAFPALVYGVKDSAGVWADSEKLLGEKDLAILIGDERHLAAAARLGGAGAISGMANLIPARLARMLATGEADSGIDALVNVVVGFPVTPAVKAMVAHVRADPQWAEVRAPLEPTEAANAAKINAMLDGLMAAEAA